MGWLPRRFVLLTVLIILAAFSIYLFLDSTHKNPSLVLEHVNGVVSGSFSPSGELIAISTGDDCKVYLWAVGDGSLRNVFDLCSDERKYKQTSGQLIFSPDGKKILIGAYAGNIAQTIDAQTGKSITYFIGHSDFIRGVSWSSDGSKVATASKDSSVRIWDSTEGSTIQVLKGHTEPINDVRFSYDGSLIVTASDDNSVIIWDVATGHLIKQLLGHTDDVKTAEFTPDNQKILTSSYDGTVRTWLISSGNELLKKEFGGWISNAAWSNDGTKIVTGVWLSDKAFLLSADDGEILKELIHTEPEHGHLQFAILMPHSYVIATAAGNIVKIWKM